jgi:ABC-type multidrug transport system fused ATPase/permease subunit
MDEATSALDPETEQGIQGAIEKLSDDITIIVIAHRLSTVRRANRIVVLEEGRIVEQGTYSELLSSNGRFSKLHAFQSAPEHSLSPL